MSSPLGLLGWRGVGVRGYTTLKGGVGNEVKVHMKLSEYV